ncbi:3-dehydroquinate dehydratase [Dehalococcoides mccartyi]|uniref:type I 3-dehydroquinate dehydratase n=1 Tax=Dehalococcoides mccartyi TaxID=61435 RepID=UPI0004E09E0C|nr:type I 3-dehydroquinate dehydratase [Dehalococcoides mccartyi]AII57612.1 3-dehydroquinate dehydratase [Dehalococcoides mccartyi CG1]APH12097.1 3-dehydroquinate dehydratase [Dehalococcoides mccartyi]
MKTPSICCVITRLPEAESLKKSEGAAFYELRLDLLGESWQETAAMLNKPFIATCRRAAEGGSFSGSEEERISRLEKAAAAGAFMLDIEYSSPNLGEILKRLRPQAKCLLSHHNFTDTPSAAELKTLVKDMLTYPADIYKVITTAASINDNIKLLNLIKEMPDKEIVAFAMGEPGILSRILCPLAGSPFTYASLNDGNKSASGQMTLAQMIEIYRSVNYENHT